MKVILATAPDELRAAYALRYRAYRELGTIPEHPEGVFVDSFDPRPYARIVIVQDGGEAIATARALVTRGPHEPVTASELFSDALTQLNPSPDAPIYEVTRMAVAPSYRSSPEPLYRMFGFIAHLATADRAGHYIAPVREQQARGYRMLLGMRELAPEVFSPSQQVGLRLMGADSQHALVHATRRYAQYFPTPPAPAEVR